MRNTKKGKPAAVLGNENFQCVLEHFFLRTQDKVSSMLVCEQEVKSGLAC